MEIEVIVEKEEISFPCTMISVYKEVILATGESDLCYDGYLLIDRDKKMFLPMGKLEFNTSWPKSEFKKLKGKITFIND